MHPTPGGLSCSDGFHQHARSYRVIGSLTPLAPLLLGAVDVVLQLDADLPLVGQVADVGVLEQLLRAGPLVVVLHQAAVHKRLELLRPEEEKGGGEKGGEERRGESERVRAWERQDEETENARRG